MDVHDIHMPMRGLRITEIVRLELKGNCAACTVKRKPCWTSTRPLILPMTPRDLITSNNVLSL